MVCIHTQQYPALQHTYSPCPPDAIQHAKQEAVEPIHRAELEPASGREQLHCPWVLRTSSAPRSITKESKSNQKAWVSGRWITSFVNGNFFSPCVFVSSGAADSTRIRGILIHWSVSPSANSNSSGFSLARIIPKIVTVLLISGDRISFDRILSKSVIILRVLSYPSKIVQCTMAVDFWRGNKHWLLNLLVVLHFWRPLFAKVKS